MILNQYSSILYNFLFPSFIRKQLLAELQFEYNFTLGNNYFHSFSGFCGERNFAGIESNSIFMN